jgi:hypothetical protein
MIAGGAGAVGDLVYVDANGRVQVADASVAGTVATALGIVVSAGSLGAVAFVAGDPVSIVTFGPVAGFTITPGGLVYASDTAGAVGDAAGTVSKVVGIELTANILFVNIQL